MEPLENQELNDRELDGLLREWKPPTVPAGMRARVFAGERRPWWRRMWTASIRVPLPIAACLMLAVALGAWRWLASPPPRVLIRTERVEVPVVKEHIVTRLIYTDRPAPTSANVPKLQAVTELRPRIIRNEELK